MIVMRRRTSYTLNTLPRMATSVIVSLSVVSGTCELASLF